MSNIDSTREVSCKMDGGIPFQRKRINLTRNMVINLTESGKDIVEKQLCYGERFRILSTIEECPHCTVHQIAEETRIGIQRLKDSLEVLAGQGFIKISGMD